MCFQRTQNPGHSLLRERVCALLAMITKRKTTGDLLLIASDVQLYALFIYARTCVISSVRWYYSNTIEELYYKS
jgi:hypothetical protein